MQDETFDRPARAYVDTHFMTLEAIAEAAGCPSSQILDLAAAGVAPGAVYARDPSRGWWSALGGWVDGDGEAPASDVETWLSPGSVWAYRQALLAQRRGEPAEDFARRAEDQFRKAFVDALAAEKAAPVAFADCFDERGGIDPSAAGRRADAEWRSWLQGAYAVCLRTFTGETCVRKESLGALLKRHIADPHAWPMTAEAALETCATLAQIMLPFAPWERPTGTPGRTLDVLLARHDLGREAPYERPD